MMLSLGKTTTSYTFMRKQSPSLSWGSAVSVPLFPALSVFVRLGANILGHLVQSEFSCYLALYKETEEGHSFRFQA